MSGIPIHLKTGPKTYTPAENILGGQVVEARPNGRIGVAAAGSVTTLGVALVDGEAPEAVALGTTVVNGRPLLVAGFTPVAVAVAYGGMEVPVTYSAAATLGQQLVVTANGQVAPGGSAAIPARTFNDGATTLNSAVVTSVTGAFTTADVGRGISGAGIAAGTTVLSVQSGTSLTMSANATATAAGVSVTLAAVAATPAAAGTVVGKCTDTTPAGVAAGATGLMTIL